MLYINGVGFSTFPLGCKMKKLNVPTLNGSHISVWFNDEYDEYQVKVSGNKNATYFTSDKKDALQTAQFMRNTIKVK